MTQSIAREEEGANPIPKCIGCEALSFATACKRGKNLKNGGSAMRKSAFAGALVASVVLAAGIETG